VRTTASKIKNFYIEMERKKKEKGRERERGRSEISFDARLSHHLSHITASRSLIPTFIPFLVVARGLRSHRTEARVRARTRAIIRNSVSYRPQVATRETLVAARQPLLAFSRGLYFADRNRHRDNKRVSEALYARGNAYSRRFVSLSASRLPSVYFLSRHFALIEHDENQ